MLLVLGACVHLPHVDPKPRNEDQRMRAAVLIESYCSFGYPQARLGSGVVISERLVLTAAHIVECPVIPRVYITTHNGNRHRAVVDREDRNADIARLEIAHAGRLDVGIAPPELVGPWDHPTEVVDYLCAYPPHEPTACGPRLSDDLFKVHLKRGTSGSGVYDRGYLVGIVIRTVSFDREQDFHVGTRIAIVTPSWLEGT
jgi:hypothetical protein